MTTMAMSCRDENMRFFVSFSKHTEVDGRYSIPTIATAYTCHAQLKKARHIAPACLSEGLPCSTRLAIGWEASSGEELFLGFVPRPLVVEQYYKQGREKGSPPETPLELPNADAPNPLHVVTFVLEGQCRGPSVTWRPPAL